MVHPLAVTPCNMDMEGLINDSNRSIATLAITTLLKTVPVVDKTHQPWAPCDPRAHQPWAPC